MEEEDDTCKEFSSENTLANYSVLNTVKTGPNVFLENYFKCCYWLFIAVVWMYWFGVRYCACGWIFKKKEKNIKFYGNTNVTDKEKIWYLTKT